MIFKYVISDEKYYSTSLNDKNELKSKGFY